MNFIKTLPRLLFLLAMFLSLIGCASPDITLINVKTGKTCSPSFSSFRQALVDIDTKSHQFDTLRRKDNSFTKDSTFIYTTYDISCRKLKEQTFPLLFKNYGRRNIYAVRDGKIAYIKEQTKDDLKKSSDFSSDLREIHLYDIATKENKVIASNIVSQSSDLDSLIRWISATKVLIFANGKLFTIDTVSGEQKDICHINYSGYSKIELSPNYEMLAYIEETERMNAVIKILELGSGKTIKTIGSGTERITSLQWSPDFKELAYVEGNQLKVCNVASGNERTLTKKMPAGYIFYYLAFGKDIVGYACEHRTTVAAKTTLYFVKADTGDPIRNFQLEFNGSIRLLDNDCTFVCETGY